MFPEEYELLGELLDEWYEGMRVFTEECNGIFSDKAEQYDRESPVWRRISWPDGFVQEMRKKVDRLKQLLSTYDKKDFDSVRWDALQEELADIVNYARMFGALNLMWKRRMEE